MHAALLPLLVLSSAMLQALAERSVTDLRCEVGNQNIVAPAKLTPKLLERPPVGAIAPQGWLLEQLLLQSNSLAGYLSTSTFPGADHVNMSAWSGGNGSKAGGTIQWLPYWTNGQVPLLGLIEAAKAVDRVESGMKPIIDDLMTYVLAHTNKSNGWIGPFVDEPGDSNGHGLWDPLNMIRSLFMYAEYHPEKEEQIAAAVVAHLTEESKLLVTDPVIKWAQTRWPTFVEICQYVVDYYVPKYGSNKAVMPLGPDGTTEMLLNASALFANKGMNWLNYYHRNGSIKFPFADVHGWNTNDHGVNNAEGAVRWPAVTYRMTGAAEDADQMDYMLGMLDTYQGQVQSLLCADEVFCGRAPHRGTETCTEVEAMASLEFAFEVFGTPDLMDRVERMAFNAMPAALTADMWTHVYVQQANSVFAGNTKPKGNDRTTPLQSHALHHSHQTYKKPCGGCSGSDHQINSAVGLGDTPSGEDQGANFYGVSHFPCCITNFPQGWPKFAMSAFLTQRPVGGAPAAVVVASLVPAMMTFPPWLGKGEISTNSSYPFGDDAEITVQASKALAVKVRIPGWADKATINGKTAPNGTLVTVACAVGTTTIQVSLNPDTRVEKGWGELAVPTPSIVSYSSSGAAIPCDPANKSLFNTAGGASFVGSATHGYTDMRSGSPGQNSSVELNSLLVGEGHYLSSVSMAYRYIAGYGCSDPGKACNKKASTLSVALVDSSTGAEIQTVYTSPPLGDYDFSKGKYSPTMRVNVDGLKIPNSKPIMLKLKFANNERNLQLQLAPDTGLNISVGWTTGAAPGPHPSPPKFLRAATNGLAVVRGPLVFALHPKELVSIVRNYTNALPYRPQAVDYQIETTDTWNYAIDTSVPPTFSPTPSSGWSEKFPFGGATGPSTSEYPFSVQVQARELPSWGFWEGSKITDNLPPSPINCDGVVGDDANVGECGATQTLKLVPFGLTNIRVSVFPWM